MKKTILFLALAISMGNVSWGQYSSANVKTEFTQTIVRSWDNQWVLSAYSDINGYQRFALTNLINYSGTYNPLGFSANYIFSDTMNHVYSVNDVRILGNIAFFCGTMQTSSVPENYIGIVGYFDLQSFRQSNFNPIIPLLPDIFYLKKLTVFNVNNTPKVVAIGYDSSQSHNAIILEMHDIINNPSSNTLSTLGALNENLDDVIFTGNSIVFVGTIWQGANMKPSIRNMDNPSFLSQSSLFDTLCFFGINQNEINARTHSTVMENGRIAVTYVHTIPSSSLFYTRMRVIDTYLSSPQNILSQEFNIDNKEEPEEIIYSPLFQKLTILQPIDHTNNTNPQFIFLQPYSPFASYTANFSYFTQNYLNYVSLDIFHGHSIVSVGNNHIFLQRIANQGNSGCPYQDLRKVVKIDDLRTNLIPNIPQLSSATVITIPYNQTSNSMGVTTTCVAP